MEDLEIKIERFLGLLINIAKCDAMPRVICDFEKRFLVVNQLFADLLGYEVSELKNRPFSDFIVPEDVVASEEIYEENKIPGKIELVENFENRYIRKDGTIIHILWLKWFNDYDNQIGTGQCIENPKYKNI